MKKNKRRLRGERLAILRDEAAETIGSGILIAAEQYKEAPLSGTVVAVGSKVSPDEGCFVGQTVNFNKFNVLQFSLSLSEFDDPVILDVLHLPDIYWEEVK